jgi:flagellar biosynthesis anti-sigma factor FlgM
MKVDSNASSLTGVLREAQAQESIAARGRAAINNARDDAAVEDTIRVSQQAASLAALQTEILGQPDVRADKVAALRESTQKGNHGVTAEQIAEAMVKDSED